MLVLVGLDCLLTLVACLLLVGALPLEALTALLGADLVAALCLDTVALLLDGLVLLEVGVLLFVVDLVLVACLFLDVVALLLDGLYLLLDGVDLLVDVLLELVLLELVRLDLFCLLLDRRPRRPPLLAIVFLCYTVVIPLNH